MAERRGVQRRVGECEREQDGEEADVAPLRRREQRRREHRDEGGQERDVERRRDERRYDAGEQHRRAAEQPEPDEDREARSDDGRRLRPHGHRRQQEAGDRGDHHAEEHLVGVPGDRVVPAGHRTHPAEHDEPDRHVHAAIRCGQQEEGTESSLEDRSIGKAREGVHGPRSVPPCGVPRQPGAPQPGTR